MNKLKPILEKINNVIEDSIYNESLNNVDFFLEDQEVIKTILEHSNNCYIKVDFGIAAEYRKTAWFDKKVIKLPNNEYLIPLEYLV